MLRIKTKIVFFTVLGLLLVFAFTPRGYAQSSEFEPQSFPYTKKFIISGYYTPLPNQARYVTGSFEGDVRLNGEGVHAADGTLVYPGMAAAPRTFPFGTKMNIPGYGIVAVHDRGGAIKNNRLDIWLGSGEEGLARALGWGMRTLDVTVYGIDPNIQESVTFDGIPLARLEAVISRTQHFKSDLGDGDSGDAVLELQRFLGKLGYMKAEPTGYFGAETQEAVRAFQLAEGLIPNAEDPAAGNFGPRSRVALEQLLIERKNSLLDKLPNGTLMRRDAGENVKNLQEVLVEYSYLKEATGTFDDPTMDALARFQLDFEVIAARTDKGAGYYGPRTKSALQSMLETKYTPRLGKLISPAQLRPVAATPFSKSLAKEERGEEIEKLQEELQRLHFLAIKPTGYYGAFTEHAVFKFQQSFGIVEDRASEGAGVAGPKTLEKLNEIAATRKGRRALVAETTEKRILVAERVNEERVLLVGPVQNEAFASDASYGMRGDDVLRLQKVLKRLGFFPGRIPTSYYGDITKQSVIAFQKSHAVAESGNFDSETRRVLNKILTPSQPS